MRQQHGDIAFIYLKGDEQQHEADGCHDLWVHHRKVVHLLHDITDDFSRLAQTDG